MEKLGVIGGMGAEATSYYYDQVVRHTAAACDQEHIDMVVLSKSTMPDRTLAIKTGDASLAIAAAGLETNLAAGAPTKATLAGPVGAVLALASLENNTMSELFGVSIDELIYGENAEVLSTKHLAAEQKRAVADLLQGLTLYNDGNDKDGLARTRLLLQVIKAMGL